MTDPVLPPIADGEQHSLDPRSIALERTVGWIVFAIVSSGLLLGLILLLLLAPLPGWAMAVCALLWIAATLGLAWLAHRWPELEYRHTSYIVDAEGIEIRKGVVWRAIISVPRSRVQHTDVSQGPLERRHGLGTVVVYTAGTDYARIDLGGLHHATALSIRDHLLSGERSDAV